MGDPLFFKKMPVTNTPHKPIFWWMFIFVFQILEIERAASGFGQNYESESQICNFNEYISFFCTCKFIYWWKTTQTFASHAWSPKIMLKKILNIYRVIWKSRKTTFLILYCENGLKSSFLRYKSEPKYLAKINWKFLNCLF